MIEISSSGRRGHRNEYFFTEMKEWDLDAVYITSTEVTSDEPVAISDYYQSHFSDYYQSHFPTTTNVGRNFPTLYNKNPRRTQEESKRKFSTTGEPMNNSDSSHPQS